MEITSVVNQYGKIVASIGGSMGVHKITKISESINQAYKNITDPFPFCQWIEVWSGETMVTRLNTAFISEIRYADMTVPSPRID